LSSGVRLIVGLGNPGLEYAHTRHNVGYWFVDELAHTNQAHFKNEKKFQSEVARTPIAGEDIWLLKPLTFMNLSGQAMQSFVQFYRLHLDEVLVVHDELDLPPGAARLKTGGGHGGHNGLRDIIQRFGSKEFKRLRIGIGHPGDKNRVTNYVLNRAPNEDTRLIEQAIDKALYALPLAISGEMQRAMNSLHTEEKRKERKDAEDAKKS
jgi:PTH1 family peptidyl-tRNA hydrolase